MSSPVMAYPDAELVFLTILEEIAPTVTWLPNGWEPPIIQIRRVGGSPDVLDVTDLPLVQVSYYGATRGVSWLMAAHGEARLRSFRCKNVEIEGYSTVLVDLMELSDGGVLDPDVDPDDRRVTQVWGAGWRRIPLL